MAERRADDAVRQELLTHIGFIREDIQRGFTSVHTRFDKIDVRVIELEKRESGHHERVKALEDEADGPHQSKRRTAVTLSLGAGGAALLLKLFDVLGKVGG